MDREALADLVAGAALVAGAGAPTELPGAGWLLNDGAGGGTAVRPDGALSRVVLSRAIGPLPRRGRTRACEMLLALNLAWPAHGGLWAGLGPGGGEVVLSLDVPLQGLTRQALARVLANFLAGALAWAEALGSFGRSDAPSLPPPSDPGWIRI